MILKFIKKMRYELTSEKMKIESERNKIQNELDRNRRFLQKLKEEEEQDYDTFSPRRKNMKIYDHIKLLEQEQQNLSETLETVEENLLQTNSRLKELDDISKLIRDQALEAKKENQNRDIDSYVKKNIKILIQKIDLSAHLLVVDPNRCRMELSAVKKALQEMQEMCFKEE